MIRVGFPFMDGNSAWMGGINYLRNLMQAVLADPARTVDPVLLVPVDMPAGGTAHFADIGVQILRCPLLGARGLKARAGVAMKRVLGRDPFMERWLKQHDIHLVSHLTTLGARSRVPSIAWIPDFQHLRLPELFPAEMRAKRDAMFRRLSHQATCVIVSSNDAMQDLAGFLPDAVARTHVLPFVADVSDDDIATRAQLQEAHGFSEHYFFLPNQFWPHKNHALVIAALAHLKAQGAAVPLVLATGNPRNNHDPDLFDRLTEQARAQGVADRFRPLGLVSRRDLLGLLDHAVALINPSQFEGWSSTVEEAKTVGKQMLLSDIAVHLDQAPDARFFGTDDASGLANAMLDTLSAYDEPADRARMAQAKIDFPNRRLAFARQYQQIVAATLSAHRTSTHGTN